MELIKTRECIELTGFKGPQIRRAFDQGEVKGERKGKFYMIDKVSLLEWVKLKKENENAKK